MKQNQLKVGQEHRRLMLVHNQHQSERMRFLQTKCEEYKRSEQASEAERQGLELQNEEVWLQVLIFPFYFMVFKLDISQFSSLAFLICCDGSAVKQAFHILRFKPGAPETKYTNQHQLECCRVYITCYDYL